MPQKFQYIVADPAGAGGKPGYVTRLPDGSWGFTADHHAAHVFANEDEAKQVRRQLQDPGLLVLPVPVA
jgi:hypothetical protein